MRQRTAKRCLAFRHQECKANGLHPNAESEDLNASPLLPALQEAVRRGVEVTYYVCMGYNNTGNLLPFQGGRWLRKVH
jgi:hypothetical protein